MNILNHLLQLSTPSSFMKHAKHSGRILQIGFGGVGQTILPIVLRHLELDPSKITVLEKDDHQSIFSSRYQSTGVCYVQKEIVRANLDQVLSSYVGEGDLLINVSLNIDGIEIVEWCLKHGVMYIDTSIERWSDVQDETIPDHTKRTLYYTHSQIREMGKKYPGGPTCLVTHGANPGLVSHFTKAALLDFAQHLKLKTEVPIDRDGWAKLMEALGVQVVHIAERDTQVLDEPKLKNEFVNTWSCEGFWAEGRAPSELGWGTHETSLPTGAITHQTGPKNAIFLDRPGVSLLVKSWVPKGGNYNGFMIQHSEAITISEYFTVYTGNKVQYRPTVHYVYCPCDAALVSVHEFRGKELEIQDQRRIAKNEITQGIDELGVLLLGTKGGWFYGSQLGIEEARRLLPGENATTVQVGSSMLGALIWMLENPTQGYVEPEMLPHDQVLKYARQYLGPMVSQPTDWKPTEHRNALFKKPMNLKNVFAFENFEIFS